MSMSTTTIEAAARIATCDHPFYAADFGLSGAAMSGLSAACIVVATGKTKECFYPVGNDLYRKSVAKEWEVNHSCVWKKSIDREIRKMREIVRVYEANFGRGY